MPYRALLLLILTVPIQERPPGNGQQSAYNPGFTGIAERAPSRWQIRFAHIISTIGLFVKRFLQNIASHYRIVTFLNIIFIFLVIDLAQLAEKTRLYFTLRIW